MVGSTLEISLVEALAVHHLVRNFKCGKHSLDLFLRRDALVNQLADSSRSYVVHRQNVVVGYYTLAFGSVRLDESPQRIRASMPAKNRYPVPVMIFARFAVDLKMQGRGIGTALLKDAFLRTAAASEIGGLAAILVDAIDDKMVDFYKRYGFEECPAGERKLMIPIKHVREHLLAEPDK